MKYSFEKFTLGGSRFSPKVSIRSNGSLGLSQGILLRAGISDNEWYVVLHYAREEKVIGIQLTRDKDAQGAVKLIYRKSGTPENVTAAISAKSFLNYFDIPYDKTTNYEAEWDLEDQMIIIPLKDQN